VKVCPSCGYERQQKDDEAGIVPANECPKLKKRLVRSSENSLYSTLGIFGEKYFSKAFFNILLAGGLQHERHRSSRV
jgi:hypothetical protein